MVSSQLCVLQDDKKVPASIFDRAHGTVRQDDLQLRTKVRGKIDNLGKSGGRSIKHTFEMVDT